MGKKVGRMAIPVLALFLMLVMAGSASAATVSEVSVSVSPTTIMAGETVTITVDITLDQGAGTGGETFTGTVTVTDPDEGTTTADISITVTEGQATGSTTVTYPTDFTDASTDAAGTYSVTATVGDVEATQPVTFRVATISITPDSGPIGTEVTVTGSGFAASTSYRIWFDENGNNAYDDGEAYVDITTEADGTIPTGTTLTVPMVAAGSYSVYIDQSPYDSPEAFATFTVVIAVILDAEYYHTGDTVTVTVADASANLDPMAINEVTVDAKSSTDTIGDTITLKETGADTGIFVGYVHLIREPPADREADEIVVSAEDTITVTYESLTATAYVDDVAPVIEITAPEDGAFVGGEAVSIAATIDELHLETVSVLIDGVEVKSGGDDILPYSWNTTAYDDGVHTIKVVATDEAGNVGWNSTSVNVDNTPPSVTDPAASPSVIVPGRVTTITLTVKVTDDVIPGVTGSGVASVTVDCTEVGIADPVEMSDEDGDGVYTAEITVTVAEEGLYNLTITATDLAENVNDTEKIVITALTDTEPPVFVSTEVRYPVGEVSARPQHDTIQGDPVEITVVVTDDLSGVQSVTIDASNIDARELQVSRIEGTDTWIATLKVGVVNPGVYNITITATDFANNENSTTVQVNVTATLTAYNIQLDEGWNLISLPLIPDNSSIEVILADIATHVDVVWSYDAETGNWSMYDPSAPEVSDLTQMVDGKGYWIKMSAPATLTIHGVELKPAPATPPSYKVVPGWNLIGFKEIDEMPANEYLGGIIDNVVTIYTYSDGVFQRISLTDGGQMVPGFGYWIAVTEEGYIYP